MVLALAVLARAATAGLDLYVRRILVQVSTADHMVLAAEDNAIAEMVILARDALLLHLAVERDAPMGKLLNYFMSIS